MTIFHTPQLLDIDLVDGDLCEISVRTRSGRKHYCGADPAAIARDVDGSKRVLCQDHTDLYFPGMSAAERN
jgi:hypothetical protein